MPPKLTIGIATHSDPLVVMTLQFMALQYKSIAEFIVVDNNPAWKHAKELHKFCREADFRLIKSERFDDQGTSGPRQRIFEEAKGEAVVVCDGHIAQHPGALTKLVAFYDENPDCRDLLTGPLLTNGLQQMATHYNPGFRSEMWGKWGQTWRAPGGQYVSAVRRADDSTEFLEMPDATKPLRIGECKYGHHGKLLHSLGYVMMGLDESDDFEIPGMGLGFFSCRRDAWVNFHPDFRGFGGAEQYIHDLFKDRGNCTRSLGFLSWWHCFAKVVPRESRLHLEDKVANIIIGRTSRNKPLDDAYEHFVVERKRYSPPVWRAMVANPLGKDSGGPPPTEIGELYERTLQTRGGFQKHMPTVRNLAERCEGVTEIGSHRGSLVAILAGHMARYATTSTTYPEGEHNVSGVCSWNTDKSKLLGNAIDLAPWATITREPFNSTGHHTDLLVISKKVAAIAELEYMLNAFLPASGPLVNRWIVLHDMVRHKEAPRLMQRKLIDRGWFVMAASSESGGLIVFGRQKQDRPARVIHAWVPGYGPGTELRAILKSINIVEKPGCDCNGKMVTMDLWGVEGCRENMATIVQWMKDGHRRWGWKDKIAAAARAVQSGLAFKLNPLDPFPSLIEEAIRRAEESARARASA